MVYIMDLIKQNFLELIRSSSRISNIIQVIGHFRSERLLLTGGSLRNVVWNNLHFYSEDYELEDCDIIFYNATDISRNHEESIRKKLELLNPEVNWSVKNQARMHIRNKHKPYKSILDALIAFPETCSAVAVDKDWKILSPYGLHDLYNLIVTPTKYCLNNEIEVYRSRIIKKNWYEKWSDLKIE
jgi:uncharacterized protein